MFRTNSVTRVVVRQNRKYAVVTREISQKSPLWDPNPHSSPENILLHTNEAQQSRSLSGRDKLILIDS